LSNKILVNSKNESEVNENNEERMNSVTEILFMNNVEFFSEILTDNISGGIGSFVSDTGEVMELVRRRRRGHRSESECGRFWRLETKGIINIVGKLRVEKM
jgi:hypothetical protein